VRSCASTGFGGLAAEDGYEPIRVLVDHQVDLLFTHIAMPGISGVQPARQAKLMRGDLRVLHITSDAAQASGKGSSTARFSRSLPEPTKSWPRSPGL
jgi:CheY-like chemotaxis protein